MNCCFVFKTSPQQQILMLSVARSLREAKHNNTKVNCYSFCNKKEQEQLKTEIRSGLIRETI